MKNWRSVDKQRNSKLLICLDFYVSKFIQAIYFLIQFDTFWLGLHIKQSNMIEKSISFRTLKHVTAGFTDRANIGLNLYMTSNAWMFLKSDFILFFFYRIVASIWVWTKKNHAKCVVNGLIFGIFFCILNTGKKTVPLFYNRWKAYHFHIFGV